ncbi:hypothetical protein HNQ59_000022 [Chitinivorax tropicus]|uniref:Uncharacterized protein n=1 Tax=Chitinivorax tropicus TaxID=714531 RepID=A0A840MED4_9PROT|nr:hypothetical protein [Chitinivorax tropicus]MBB5016760.1 hypothetical protein [Chitinivorax tropicus]
MADHVSWQWNRIISNVVMRFTLDLIIVGLLYFAAGRVWQNLEPAAIQLFIAAYLPCALVIVTAETLFDERNRLSSSAVAASSQSGSPLGSLDLWSGLVAMGGGLAALCIGGLMWLSSVLPASWGTLALILALLWSSLVLASLITVRWMGLGYLKRFALQSHQDNRPATESESDDRMFGAYLLPWGLLAAVLCGLISYRYFSGPHYGGAGSIPFKDAVYSLGGTVYVVGMWICHVCKNQAMADVRHGWIVVPESEQIKEADMYLLLHGAAGALTAGGMVISNVFVIEHLPFWLVLSLEICLGAAAAVGGALLGVARGAALAMPMRLSPLSDTAFSSKPGCGGR